MSRSLSVVALLFCFLFLTSCKKTAALIRDMKDFSNKIEKAFPEEKIGVRYQAGLKGQSLIISLSATSWKTLPILERKKKANQLAAFAWKNFLRIRNLHEVLVAYVVVKKDFILKEKYKESVFTYDQKALKLLPPFESFLPKKKNPQPSSQPAKNVPLTDSTHPTTRQVVPTK